MKPPVAYTPELGAEICRRIAAGETLVDICRGDSMPCRETFSRWVGDPDKPELDHIYARAREHQAEVFFDEVISIADETPATSDDIQQAKLRIDSRKWALARMNRAKYGDSSSLNLGGQDGNPVKTESVSVKVDPAALPDEDRAALMRVLHRSLQVGE